MRRGLQFISRRFCSSNLYTTRTHNCGQLRLEDVAPIQNRVLQLADISRIEEASVGKPVSVSGWLKFKRMNKFLVLRDAYGTVQACIPNERDDISSLLKDTPYESVVSVRGVVRDRGADRNVEMHTGCVEIAVEDLTIENGAPKVLPLRLENENTERNRLQYRYLDIRSSRMQTALRLRSSVVHSMRKFLVDHRAFVDVETPTLFRRTPGGAAEFQVPAPKPNRGKCYSLPQSPQQFKQLLMVGGIDRYFQIARCYRDEGSKLDRQPEFTQVDLELSFTNQEGVMALVEDLIVESWPDALAHLMPKSPFERMTYSDAMRLYGIDKPDLRIPWTIRPCTELLPMLRPLGAEEAPDADFVVSCIVCKGAGHLVTSSNQKEWKRLLQMNQTSAPFASFPGRKDVWFKGANASMLKENLQVCEEDAVVFSWGPVERVQYTLGQMRLLVGERLGLREQKLMKFLWVVDFPLFVEEEEGKICAAHHPFTAPTEETAHLIGDPSNALKVRGQHYDLVANGVELGGGSIRIHNADLQEHVLKNILEEDTTELRHLIEALRMGAPPHGGFALGLDRYIALLFGQGDTSVPVREVIAFPKSKDGRDIMSDAPCVPSAEQLEKYAIRFTHCDQAEDVESDRKVENV